MCSPKIHIRCKVGQNLEKWFMDRLAFSKTHFFEFGDPKIGISNQNIKLLICLQSI